MNRETADLRGVNPSTVDSYSNRGSEAYDDPTNLQFLYGKITREFVRNVTFSPGDRMLLDIGTGTGLVFDILRGEIERRDLRCLGVDPASGMLDIAIKKFAGQDRYRFAQGSFENLPAPDKSVDKIVSTLALHWVTSLETAAAEMARVLKDTGSLDILMIARDDGARFKKAIVAAQKRHLTFKQIMRTATLVQRVRPDDVRRAFEPFHERYRLEVTERRSVVHGTFDQHMVWWKARSSPVVAEVEDKDAFMADLRIELEKTATRDGIPFDSAVLSIKARSVEA